MPSNKDKKFKKISRVGSSKPKAEERQTVQVKPTESRPLVAAATPDKADKYKFTEDYLNWLEVERGEMNQRQVNQVTERIFDSVLSKMGWARNEEGNLEHRGN